MGPWKQENTGAAMGREPRETGKQGQPQGMGGSHKIAQRETENEVCGPFYTVECFEERKQRLKAGDRWNWNMPA